MSLPPVTIRTGAVRSWDGKRMGSWSVVQRAMGVDIGGKRVARGWCNVCRSNLGLWCPINCFMSRYTTECCCAAINHKRKLMAMVTRYMNRVYVWVFIT